MNTFSKEKFLEMPVLGIVRNLKLQELESMLPAYVHAGFTSIEVTLNTPDYARIMQAIRQWSEGKLMVGAGTVRSLKDLDDALDAGAEFIVTPVLNQDVMKRCADGSIPFFPGAFTPTEISEAHDAGALMVKVFPAAQLGPEFIKNVKAPMPEVKLMPTGGVNIELLEAYCKAGADGFGLGAPLFTADLLRQGNTASWEAHFLSISTIIKRFVKKVS